MSQLETFESSQIFKFQAETGDSEHTARWHLSQRLVCGTVALVGRATSPSHRLHRCRTVVAAGRRTSRRRRGGRGGSPGARLVL